MAETERFVQYLVQQHLELHWLQVISNSLRTFNWKIYSVKTSQEFLLLKREDSHLQTLKKSHSENITSLLYQLLSPQHLRFHFSFLKREAHLKLYTAAVLEGNGGKCLLHTAVNRARKGRRAAGSTEAFRMDNKMILFQSNTTQKRVL